MATNTAVTVVNVPHAAILLGLIACQTAATTAPSSSSSGTSAAWSFKTTQCHNTVKITQFAINDSALSTKANYVGCDSLHRQKTAGDLQYCRSDNMTQLSLQRAQHR